MSSLLTLATELRSLNEELERGEHLDQLIVLVPAVAEEAAIGAAVAAEAASRGVRLDQVEQVVVVRRYEHGPAADVQVAEVL